MANHSSTLAWRTPWTEEQDRLQSIEMQKGRHDFATNFHFFTPALQVDSLPVELPGKWPLSQVLNSATLAWKQLLNEGACLYSNKILFTKYAASWIWPGSYSSPVPASISSPRKSFLSIPAKNIYHLLQNYQKPLCKLLTSNQFSVVCYKCQGQWSICWNRTPSPDLLRAFTVKSMTQAPSTWESLRSAALH